MDTDMIDENDLEGVNNIPGLLQSTVVQKRLLIKILRQLEILLDEEHSEGKIEGKGVNKYDF